ncbi:MAG: hypothetical protein HYZ17_12755 [Betaproteobacteria bacterium]|nr:hypothetical protein [Betaproteobacteria bacterium]
MLRALQLALICTLAFESLPAISQEALEPDLDKASNSSRPIASDDLPDMSDFPPVYLYKDNEGRDYTLEMIPAASIVHVEKSGLHRRLLDTKDHALLARTKVKVKYLPDPGVADSEVSQTKQTCNGTLPPTSFTILGTGGANVLGSVGICKINIAKPANSHTHWIQFVVGTYRVASNQVHVPVAAWFKPQMHGHGMYFGDTSSSACINNGQPSTYNTRIEAWSVWPGYVVRSSPYFQSTGYTYNDTCGMPWQDSFSTVNNALADNGTRFRVTVHATDDQVVMYQVDRRIGSGNWLAHTPAVWKNVTYATHWPADPNFAGPVYGQFDASANGLAFVGVPVLATAGNWFVQISSVATGWF